MKYYILILEQSQYRGIPREEIDIKTYTDSWKTIKEDHDNMRLNEAIIKRIYEICKVKGISVCGAALGGGKSPSAIYDLVKGRTQCSKVATIQSFCEGAGITLSEFFTAEYFNNLDD